MKMPIKMRIIENRARGLEILVNGLMFIICPLVEPTANPNTRSLIANNKNDTRCTKKPGSDFDFDLGSDLRRKSFQVFGSDEEVRR